MFHGCKKLKNIEELKLLITNHCIDFSFMFFGCSLLSDIKSLDKFDVSKGKNFNGMFSGCSLLSDINSSKNGMYLMEKILKGCLVIAQHCPI